MPASYGKISTEISHNKIDVDHLDNKTTKLIISNAIRKELLDANNSHSLYTSLVRDLISLKDQYGKLEDAYLFIRLGQSMIYSLIMNLAKQLDGKSFSNNGEIRNDLLYQIEKRLDGYGGYE